MTVAPKHLHPHSSCTSSRNDVINCDRFLRSAKFNEYRSSHRMWLSADTDLRPIDRSIPRVKQHWTLFKHTTTTVSVQAVICSLNVPVSLFLFCHTTELLCSPNTKYLSHLVSQSSLEIFVHDGRCYDGLNVTVRLLSPGGKNHNEGSCFLSFSLCDRGAIRSFVVTRNRSPLPGSWPPTDYIALLVCYVFHLWTHARPNVWLSSQTFVI